MQTPPESTCSAVARGDLAERMLQVGATLATAVREEPQESIADELAKLSRLELEALAVVLAALVDPTRTATELLAWVDFDEFGRALPPTPPSAQTLKDLAGTQEQDQVQPTEAFVDHNRVRRALEGEKVPLNRHERRAAVQRGMESGLSYDAIADALDMTRDAVDQAWNRIKRQARDNGLPVPQRPVLAR